MLSATAAAVLGVWGALLAPIALLAPVAPLAPIAPLAPLAPLVPPAPPAEVAPPGVAPMLAPDPSRPPPTLVDVLRQVGAPMYAPKPRGAAPPPGSATESEALRRYIRSQLRMREGQPRRATEDLDAALRLDPTSAELHRARADAAAEAGDVARAVSEWETVLALRPNDIEAALAVGLSALETGQVTRAIAVLGPAWIASGEEEPSSLNASGQFALGASLAHALIQVGGDRAALEPAQRALRIDPARLAAERGDGLDSAIRSCAALAREAGDAALRVGEPALAADLLLQSVEWLPEPRAQALAAFAAMRAGREPSARKVLVQLLDLGEPAGESQALVAEWILHALDGDPVIAARLRAFTEQAPGNGRIARLLAAADPARAAEHLDAAIALGAVDTATVRAAFRVLGLQPSIALALRTARTDPALVRVLGRELARGAASSASLADAMAQAAEGPERESIRATIAVYEQNPGAAWRIAEAAREEWPDEPAVFFALADAAAASSDPSLVQRAIVDAPPLLASDANWHANVARAALAAGLAELASASLARCDSLDPGNDVAAHLRVSSAGGASARSARGLAEQALARGNVHEAVGLLTEARALDPDDDVALGMLVGALRRTLGAEATFAWTESELARSPNSPLLWEAFALQAIAADRAAAGLARIDSHLARDPDATSSLRAREALLRSLGQVDAALVSARARMAALPPGPRRALETASVEAQAGDAGAAVDALRVLAEGAYPPPLGMRAAALDVLRRLPPTVDSCELMRRMARDAILADGSAPLEFYAFEALSVAGDPSFDAVTRAEFVGMIAAEAASAPLHRSPEAIESWRAACDFLASQGHPAEAAEFIRARLDDVLELSGEDLAVLARAAFAADALAGGGSRAVHALHLLGRLRSAGREPLGTQEAFAAAAYAELGAIFALVGDAAGAERVLEAARAIDPDDPVVLNNLAFTRAERGVADERTLDMARRAVAARPNDPSHLDTLGWVLYLNGKLKDSDGSEGAVRLLLRAIDRAGRGGSAELHLHLGDALWRTGDTDGATRAWKSALDRTLALDRAQSLELYRTVLRRQTALAAVDAERFYEEHDASVANRARVRLEAVKAGQAPPVTPLLSEGTESQKDTPDGRP